MGAITLDAEMQAKLHGLTEQLEFCDENGKTLGHFLPDDVYQKVVYGWMNLHWPDEEIDKLDEQTGGSALKEIWERLGRKLRISK